MISYTELQPVSVGSEISKLPRTAKEATVSPVKRPVCRKPIGRQLTHDIPRARTDNCFPLLQSLSQ